MQKIVPYKFEIIAICHVLDDDGNILSEQPAGQQTPDGSLAPASVFGVEGLKRWADGFEAQLENVNEAAAASAARLEP